MTKNLFRALATRPTGPLFRELPAEPEADPPEAETPRPADRPLFREPPAEAAKLRVLFLENNGVTPEGTPANPSSFHQPGGENR